MKSENDKSHLRDDHIYCIGRYADPVPIESGGGVQLAATTSSTGARSRSKQQQQKSMPSKTSAIMNTPPVSQRMPGAPLISAVGPMSHSGQPAQPQHQHPHMHMALPPQPPPPQQPPHAVMSGMPGSYDKTGRSPHASHGRTPDDATQRHANDADDVSNDARTSGTMDAVTTDVVWNAVSALLNIEYNVKFCFNIQDFLTVRIVHTGQGYPGMASMSQTGGGVLQGDFDDGSSRSNRQGDEDRSSRKGSSHRSRDEYRHSREKSRHKDRPHSKRGHSSEDRSSSKRSRDHR
eukprot:gene5407-7144_t